MSTSHKVIYAVMLSYFVGIIIGIYAVIADAANIGSLLAYIGGVAAVGIGFYSWKAKAENVIKLSEKQMEKISRIDN